MMCTLKPRQGLVVRLGFNVKLHNLFCLSSILKKPEVGLLDMQMYSLKKELGI